MRIWIGAGEADSNGHDLVKWSTADGRSGPRPPGDAEIYDMVLAREKAKLAKDFASADRIQAEMAASGFTVVYRDATGRPDKRRGAVTWFTVDGRSGPPALSTADIESRLRAWLHARRDVEQNLALTDLLADSTRGGTAEALGLRWGSYCLVHRTRTGRPDAVLGRRRAGRASRSPREAAPSWSMPALPCRRFHPPAARRAGISED